MFVVATRAGLISTVFCIILCITCVSTEESVEKALSAFSWLIAPHTVEDFMGRYWTKQHLHVSRGDETYFSKLFEADNFAAAMNQMPDEAGMGTYDKGFNNTANKYDTMCGAFMDGGGIVINAFNRGWSPLSRLCAELQGLFYMAVMNLYLTPRQAQTFTVHTDPQDVVILQIAGHKAWRVYSAPIAAPFEEQQVGKKPEAPVDMEALGEPVADLVLRPGDVLYIPRGAPHWCTTDDEASLHLTLTLPTADWSWGVLISNAVNSVVLEGEPALRKSIPLSVLHLQEEAPAHEAIEAEFLARMKDVLQRVTFGHGIRRTQEHAGHREQEKNKEAASLDHPPQKSIQSTTQVVKLPEMVEVSSESLPQGGMEGERTTIMVTSMHRSLPMRGLMRPALQFIEDAAVGTSFQVGEIPQADVFEQICMTEMLTKMGWLNVTKY